MDEHGRAAGSNATSRRQKTRYNKIDEQSSTDYRLTDGCNMGQHLVPRQRLVLSDVPYCKTSKSVFLLEFDQNQIRVS